MAKDSTATTPSIPPPPMGLTCDCCWESHLGLVPATQLVLIDGEPPMMACDECAAELLSGAS